MRRGLRRKSWPPAQARSSATPPWRQQQRRRRPSPLGSRRRPPDDAPPLCPLLLLVSAVPPLPRRSVGLSLARPPIHRLLDPLPLQLQRTPARGTRGLGVAHHAPHPPQQHWGASRAALHSLALNDLPACCCCCYRCLPTHRQGHVAFALLLLLLRGTSSRLGASALRAHVDVHGQVRLPA